MVCLLPQSQVSGSGSFEYPDFNMFTLDRPTCVRNRLSAFEVVQGFSAPAVRCSSALMLRCTLASRGSSRSLHNSMRVKCDIKENIVSGEEVYDRATWRRMSSYIDPTLKNGKKMKRKTYEKRCEI